MEECVTLDSGEIKIVAHNINLINEEPCQSIACSIGGRGYGKTYQEYMTGECINKENFRKEDNMLDRIKKYIINDKAVIIFWKDGNKTVAVCDEEDKYDKELGFLIAFFKYVNRHESKSELKRLFTYIKDENLKDYLLIIFNRFTFKNYEKSRKYLKNLKEGTVNVK